MGRAPCCDKANVKKGPWSPEEDAKLKAYIEENGTGGNWIALPQKIGLKRCGKSCRLRWLNYLRPNIRHGDFSEQEDFIICSLYISIGSRWSIIAAQLQGRTDNDVKNYWNTKLKKKMLGRKKRESSQSRRVHDHTHEPSEKANGLNHDKTSLQSITSSALERRQLHMHLQSLYNPFSSRNSNPALWPEYHDTTPVPQQGLENILPIEPTTYQTAYQVKSDMQTPMSTTIQEEEMDCSILGFHSPSDSVCALSMDHSSSKTGLQAELHGVVDGKNECFGQEDYKLDGFCDYKQITNGEKESMDSWATNGFQEETSSSSWGPWDLSAILQADSVLQEYTQRWQRNEFLD